MTIYVSLSLLLLLRVQLTSRAFRHFSAGWKTLERVYGTGHTWGSSLNSGCIDHCPWPSKLGRPTLNATCPNGERIILLFSLQLGLESPDCISGRYQCTIGHCLRQVAQHDLRPSIRRMAQQRDTPCAHGASYDSNIEAMVESIVVSSLSHVVQCCSSYCSCPYDNYSNFAQVDEPDVELCIRHVARQCNAPCPPAASYDQLLEEVDQWITELCIRHMAQQCNAHVPHATDNDLHTEALDIQDLERGFLQLARPIRSHGTSPEAYCACSGSFEAPRHYQALPRMACWRKASTPEPAHSQARGRSLDSPKHIRGICGFGFVEGSCCQGSGYLWPHPRAMAAHLDHRGLHQLEAKRTAKSDQFCSCASSPCKVDVRRGRYGLCIFVSAHAGVASIEAHATGNSGYV
jgi:hypothetical protein